MLLAHIVVAWGLIVAGSGIVLGQNFPNRPIRIVTAEPGAGADFVSRVLAQGLTSGLNQQAIVDNRGGSVVIPAGIVARAVPDGHTMLLYPGTFWIAPLLQSVDYDVNRNFSPISLVTTSPVVVVVHPGVAVGSVKELIALAREKLGQLNYGSGAAGSSTHLAAELFMSMSGTKLVRIPYKGAGPALAALIGGQVQLMFASGGSATPHIKSGKLKALAVTTTLPSPLFAGVPTVTASGLPGYEYSQILGIFAPAQTPPAIINRLHQEISRVVNQPDLRDKLFAGGLEPVGASPAQLAAAVQSEVSRMSKVIKDAGIKGDLD